MSDVLSVKHVEDAVVRLHDQHKSKPNIVALLSALVMPLQELDDTTLALLKGVLIGSAIGAQLDIIGRIVGETRQGKTDSDYRRFVRARVAANKSKGRISDIILVARLVIDSVGTTLIVEQQGKAAVGVTLEEDLITDAVASYLLGFLKVTVGAGIGVHVHYLKVAQNMTYTLGAIAILDGIHLAGSTTLLVNSTSGFAESGELVLDYAQPFEDIRTYASKDATRFFGVQALTSVQPDGVHIRIQEDFDLGLSSTSAPLTGGAWSSVIG